MRAAPLLRISTDETLARRAELGDDDAFAVLYDRYRIRLEAYCRGIVRHDEDARDAAQSALAAAYQALGRGARPRAVRAWLFRIAHNEAITVLRRRRVAAELPDELPARLAGPGDALELREELAAVLAAVRALAPGARSALLLRELGDLSYPEVAEVLGTTPAGARQAVFEARTALQADRAGRGSDCDTIRRELSAHDGRRRQARHIRGHLRGCGACRDWSREQRQRRQRLALGGAPLPLAGWLAAAFGGAAGAGGGATLTGGLAVQAQLAAASIVIVAGTAPVVIPRGAPDAPRDGAPAETATRAANLTTAAAGPARLVATSGAPAPATLAVPVRAEATRSDTGDRGRAEGRPEPADPSASAPREDRGTARRFAADPSRWDDDRGRRPREPRRDRWDAGGREGRPDRRDRPRPDDGASPWRPAHDRPAAGAADRPAPPPADPPPAEADAPEPVITAEPAPPPAPAPDAPATQDAAPGAPVPHDG